MKNDGLDLAKRFYEEYQKATVNLKVTPIGYQLYAEEVSPVWMAWLSTFLCLIWSLAVLAFSHPYGFFVSRDTQLLILMLTFLGQVIAFIVGGVFPLPMILSMVALIINFVFFFNWLIGGIWGVYVLSSFVGNFYRWFAVDKIKRAAIASEEQFLMLLKTGAIEISPARFAKQETLSFLNDINQRATGDEINNC